MLLSDIQCTDDARQQRKSSYHTAREFPSTDMEVAGAASHLFVAAGEHQ